MRATLSHLSLAFLLFCQGGPVLASEGDYLKSISGSFSGGGTVRLRTNSAPINVTCNFQSRGNDASLNLKGTCRGLLIISRAVSADIKVTGTRYAGTYIGAGSGTATLSGGRSGDRINFAIRWAKNVNGDRDAMLTVRKVGDNGLQLTTTDRDPKSGSSVTTSELKLTRR